MTCTDESRLRAELITGLLDLAVFLESHPDVPAPHWADLLVFPADGTDDEKRAEIDAIATRIGAKAVDGQSGHYSASRDFGPVQYRAVAIPNRAGQNDEG
jgi:hypothetical protein